MNKKTLESLYAPFELRERDGLGGMKFKYIPSDSVIDRMNKVLDGNWSTDVLFQDIVDDSVILRVKVSVYDVESKMSFYHEGFGSSSFKRFTGGPHVGKIIDVGNAYKSALSMAIRNACSRFGCGLYLEGDLDGAAESSKEEAFSLPPVSKLLNNNVMPVFEEPSIPMPKATDVSNIPQLPSMPQLRDIKPLPVHTGGVVDTKGLGSFAPSFPTMPAPKIDVVPMSNSIPPPISDVSSFMNGGNDDSTMSNVQEAAIDGIVQMKGFESFESLASEALGIPIEKLPPKSMIKASDAREIIKYGNSRGQGRTR
jgi:hypothetical protein